jgi:aspartyl-tRNA(Asn)/glutamyl-tRNA(Gln) amidotransferase subunit A
LIFHPAHEISQKIKKGKLSPREVVEESIRWAQKLEEKIHSFITLDPEKALERAKKIEEKISRGEETGPLAGIPVAVKDNICTRGIETTCGSKILKGFIPPYNATVVEKLEKAGAIIIGKTNCDEFAMGSSTENSAFFKTFNPWDLERVPGGSSGGSATSVASYQVFLSLGSDTGGSVRQPASFCGIYGLKPTYGRVSRFGLVAFASSLDQIGTFARNVKDLALITEAISGHDPRDSTSLPEEVPPYFDELQDSPRALRIGVPWGLLQEGISAEVKEAFEDALKIFERLGFPILEVSLPHASYGIPTYYLIAPAEASANLARYDGIRFGLREIGEGDLISLYKKTRGEGFGAEVKRRIMLGTFALSLGYREAFYLKAQKVRTLIRKDFEEAFNKVGLIALPTSPTLPFKLGEKVMDPLQMYMSDLYTIPISLAGLPAISIPVGLKNGLPVGMQIVGPPLSESLILKASHVFEMESGLSDLRPPILEEIGV